MTDIVRTQNSIYEIDREGGLIRRVSGFLDPTPLQGVDGLWQAARVTVEPFIGGLRIEWLDRPGVTLTSPVVAAE